MNLIEWINGITKLNKTTLDTFQNNINTGKQDTLTAGNGISIDNNIISVVGGTGGGDSAPIGSGCLWFTNDLPVGYLICNGAAISRETYSELFAVIGTYYGPGDGVSTFNLPDLRDYIPVGKSDTDTDINTLGQKYGAKSHTHTNPTTGSTAISINQMPSHSHTFTGSPHSHSISFYDGSNTSSTHVVKDNTKLDSGVLGTTSTGGTTAGGTNSNTGGNQGHTHSMGNTGEATTYQPSFVVNYIIKAV